MVNVFLIVSPDIDVKFLSLREIIRTGVFFRKVGLCHLVIALAYMLLIVISYFFGYDSEGLSWAVTVMAGVNFAVPYIFYS